MGGAFRVLVQKEWAPNPCVRTAVCSESSCKGIGALSPCAKRGGPSESSCKVNMSPQSSCKKSSAFGVLVQKELVLPILLLSGAFESSCKTNLCPPSSCKKRALRTLVQNEPAILVQRGRCLRSPRAKGVCLPSSCKKGSALNPRAKEWVLPTLVQSAAFRSLVQNQCVPSILVQEGGLQNPRAK